MIKYIIISFAILLLLASAVSAQVSISDISEIAEFGSETITDDWTTVTFDGEFTDPVVIAKPLAFAGSQPAHVRIRNVEPWIVNEASGSFEMKAEEWDYLDGTHTGETVSWFVIDAGTYEFDGKYIEAGTVETDETWLEVDFDVPFGGDPVLFTQPLTYDDTDAVITRNRNVDSKEFEVKLQEEEAASSAHGNETVGWIAVDPGNYSNSTKVHFDKTFAVFDHNWATLTFPEGHYDPLFFVDMQTYNGGDTAGLRYRALGTYDVDIKVEEEQSDDPERNHADEAIGYMVIEGLE